jgi:anti-sigma factor RsiW
MRTDAGANHLTELLGCYALGLTSATESDAVERHLLTCARCHDDLEDIASVGLYLASQVDAHMPELIRELKVPAGSQRRRPSTADQPRRRTLAVGLAAAAMLVVAGLGVGMWLRPSAPSSPPSTDLVASAADPATGVSAVLAITPRPDKVAIQITVNGLQVGTPYQLLLITRSGQPVVISDWRAADPTQIIRGEVPMPVVDVGYFAISRPDGTVLLAVPFGPKMLVTSRAEPPSPRQESTTNSSVQN